MLVCPNCNIEYAEGENFCSQCGARLIAASADLYCPTCNIAYPAGKKFCRYCGTALVARRGAAPEVVQPPRLPAWTCGISADGRADGSFDRRDYAALSLAEALQIVENMPVPPSWFQVGEHCQPVLGFEDRPYVQRFDNGDYFLLQDDRSCSLEEAKQCVVQVYAAAALW